MWLMIYIGMCCTSILSCCVFVSRLSFICIYLSHWLSGAASASNARPFKNRSRLSYQSQLCAAPLSYTDPSICLSGSINLSLSSWLICKKGTMHSSAPVSPFPRASASTRPLEGAGQRGGKGERATDMHFSDTLSGYTHTLIESFPLH